MELSCSIVPSTWIRAGSPSVVSIRKTHNCDCQLGSRKDLPSSALLKTGLPAQSTITGVCIQVSRGTANTRCSGK